MQTVSQAMDAFISSLKIASCDTDKDGERCGKCTRCDATRQRDLIRGHLEAAFSVNEFLISGSFKRHTAIRPLNDIDLFVVLDRDRHSDLASAAPIETLKAVQDVLDKAYPTKEHPILQGRSVNIEFVGTGLAFDVVPAFAVSGEQYTIPDRDTNRWIHTNPRLHAEHSTEANERAGKMAKPLVKALKHWNRQHDPKPVRSFHLELMVYDVLRSQPESHAKGIAYLLHRLGDRVLTRMPEPAGIGPDVDERLTDGERARARKLFLDGAAAADLALERAAAGHPGEAHFVWRQLLGSEYPEKGTPPDSKGSAPSIIVGGARATDAPTRRFG